MLMNKVNKYVTGTYKEDVKEEKKKGYVFSVYHFMEKHLEKQSAAMSLLIPNFNRIFVYIL